MGTITIVGLGAGSLDSLPRGALRALTSGAPVLLRTERHPVVARLRAEGVAFASLDEEYERADDFEQVYEAIAGRVIQAAGKHGRVVFAVPGHPGVAERTVRLLRERAPAAGHAVEFGPGQSFLDDMFLRLGVDPVQGMLLLDAADVRAALLQPRLHLVVVQMYSPALAADVKMALADVYGDEHRVILARAVGVEGEECVVDIPLYELDRRTDIDHLTTLYVPPLLKREERLGDFAELLSIVAALRDPETGCPWDLAQTHVTLRPYVIEEAYEVAHAIDGEEPAHLADELGDLLLQVALHAQIGQEEGYFEMRDVVRMLSAKLLRRHPHVFGEGSAKDADEVRANWEKIKEQEKEAAGELRDGSWLDTVKKALPPLLESRDLQRKAAAAGFDWPDLTGVFAKLREELEELEAAPDAPSRREEWGDLVFALVRLADRLGFDPEAALAEANAKFRRRFAVIERRVRESGQQLGQTGLATLEGFWQNGKENADF